MTTDHYLEKVHAQPEVIDHLISTTIDDQLRFQFDVSKTYDDITEIFIVASGSERYASKYGARLLRSLASHQVTVCSGSEFSICIPVSKRPVIIGVTRSGETATTISALRDASDRGYRSLALTSVPKSSATEISDSAILLGEDGEIEIGEPLTFTTMSIAMCLLAIFIGSQKNRISTDQVDSIIRELREVPQVIESVLHQENTIQSVATQYADCNSFFYTSTGIGIPAADEGARQLEQVAGKFAKSVVAGEMKHGALPMVSGETPVLTQLTGSTVSQQAQNNVRELHAREVPVIGIVSESHDDEDFTEQCLTEKITIPQAGKFTPIATSVGWQLFAYHVASN